MTDTNNTDGAALLPVTPETEAYCLGLLTEEAGEVLQLVGKALRFGIDTPGVKRLDGTVDYTLTSRSMLPVELGDFLAGIDFAIAHGAIDAAALAEQRRRKFAKLTDPTVMDNLGRPLAPQPANQSHSLPGDVGTRITALEEALKPFDRQARSIGLRPEQDRYSFAGTGLYNGDLRRASIVLSTALTTPPTPDRIGKEAVREALEDAFCAGWDARHDGQNYYESRDNYVTRALSATPAQEGDEAFCATVWDALKGDHTDLRRQQIILTAHRIATGREGEV